MKNFIKASLLTVMMSAGICFSSESYCDVYLDADCMICAFEQVEPGACSGSGHSCPIQAYCAH